MDTKNNNGDIQVIGLGSDVDEIEEIQDEIEKEECDETFRIFDVSDHLKRILKVMDLSLTDNNPFSILEKMLDEDLIDSMPFSQLVLDDEDKEDLKDIKGKITIMTGNKVGDEPMDVKKKVIVIDNDDLDTVEKIANKTKESIDDIYKTNHKKFASNNNNGNVQVRESLRNAYEVAKSIRSNEDVLPKVVANITSNVNLIRHANDIGNEVKDLISGVLSDLSLYIPKKEYFNSIANRIKKAYNNIEPTKAMKRQAYYFTKDNSTIEGKDGFNICPKLKSTKGQNMSILVPWAICRDNCVEGKINDDGSVTCNFALWVENVADNHIKVMHRIDEHKNPINENMKLRIKDGDRSNPPRKILRSIEQRMEEDIERGREWDDIKKSQTVKSGVSGKMMSIEALIDEVLSSKNVNRDDSGDNTPIETKLRDSFKNKEVTDITETRMNSKNADDKKYDITEKRLSEIHEENEYKENLLIDELIENKYDRSDSERE